MKIYDEEILYQIVKVFKPDRLYQHINIKGFDLRIKNSKVESKNIIVSNFVPHPLGLYRPSETVFHCAGMSSVSNREKLINKLSNGKESDIISIVANSQIVTYARVSGHYNKNNYPESFQITSILLDFQDSEEFNNSVPKVH